MGRSARRFTLKLKFKDSWQDISKLSYLYLCDRKSPRLLWVPGPFQGTTHRSCGSQAAPVHRRNNSHNPFLSIMKTFMLGDRFPLPSSGSIVLVSTCQIKGPVPPCLNSGIHRGLCVKFSLRVNLQLGLVAQAWNPSSSEGYGRYGSRSIQNPQRIQDWPASYSDFDSKI